jgi:hypothetical protein
MQGAQRTRPEIHEGASVRRPDLAALFQANGPFTSVHLATPADVPNAAQQLDLRWKDVRRDLAAAGAPEAVLAAIDPLVDGAHTRGAALTVIAGADGVLLAESLAAPPAMEASATVGPLPDVLELLRQAARTDLPWLAVRTDRTGAQVAVLGGDAKPGDADQGLEVEGETGPVITKSKPGGWSQRRYQERAERAWQANAAQVAERLTRLVDEVRPRVVALAGDVRAVQLLREAVPERVAELLREVGGELPDLDAVVVAGRPLVDELVRADTEALLARFAEERGQHDAAVEGVAGTIAALAEARVATLLLVHARDEARTAWFGPEPLHVAADPDTLRAAGVAAPVEARLPDVLLRAVYGGGGEALLLDEADLPAGAAPAEGVGGLTRWTEP